MISVIVPTLNAGACLAPTLAALVPAAVDGLIREVIVVDGGSSDRTAEIAEEAGAALVACPGGRGQQLGAGADRARFAWLLFLHADTELEPGWERVAASFMEAVEYGRRAPAAAVFRFALDDAGFRPRLLEQMVAGRCALLRLPYGDQGLLLPRSLYAEVGGFAPLAQISVATVAQGAGNGAGAEEGDAATAEAPRHVDVLHQRKGREAADLGVERSGQQQALVAVG